MNYSNLIPENTLRTICKEMADCFSGSELTNFMDEINLPHILPLTDTKHKRIFESLSKQQQINSSPNIVFRFIQETSKPINFINNRYVNMNEYLSTINVPLNLIGLTVTIKGELIKVAPATTLSEAQRRCSELISELKSRNLHSEIFKYCIPELLVNDYFHAIFESVKGVYTRIRKLSNCSTDGAALIHEVFDPHSPILIINPCTNKAQINEQNGFKQILLGITNMFRNTLAHENKIYWNVSKQDAVDLMTTLSFIHRKLDNASKIR